LVKGPSVRDDDTGGATFVPEAEAVFTKVLSPDAALGLRNHSSNSEERRW